MLDERTPSLTNKRKNKKQAKDKTPNKQSTQLFDSVRNAANEVVKDLNQSAYQGH